MRIDSLYVAMTYGHAAMGPRLGKANQLHEKNEEAMTQDYEAVGPDNLSIPTAVGWQREGRRR